MNFVDHINITALIAERKIREAMEEGQFDNLPGRGRPQKLEDLSHLPPELRPAYILLKNSGHLETSAEDSRPTKMQHLFKQSSAEGLDCAKLEKLKFLISRRAKDQSGPSRDGENPPEAGKDLEDIDPLYLAKVLRRL